VRVAIPAAVAAVTTAMLAPTSDAQPAPAPASPAPSAGPAVPSEGSGAGSARPVEHAHGRNSAWLVVGGALAFATAGTVLAYSASASEQDVKDLYAGVDGRTPTFDPPTQQRYHDLIDEGRRYQHLSWAAFGVAATCGVAATILFLRPGDERVTVAPLASPHGGGLAAAWQF
jgi:hypothetical protein